MRAARRYDQLRWVFSNEAMGIPANLRVIEFMELGDPRKLGYHNPILNANAAAKLLPHFEMPGRYPFQANTPPEN